MVTIGGLPRTLSLRFVGSLCRSGSPSGPVVRGPDVVPSTFSEHFVLHFVGQVAVQLNWIQRRGRAANFQLSTFNFQPSTFNLQLSTFNFQPSTLKWKRGREAEGRWLETEQIGDEV